MRKPALAIPPGLLTAEQAAEWMGISRSQFYKLSMRKVQVGGPQCTRNMTLLALLHRRRNNRRRAYLDAHAWWLIARHLDSMTMHMAVVDCLAAYDALSGRDRWTVCNAGVDLVDEGPVVRAMWGMVDAGVAR